MIRLLLALNLLFLNSNTALSQTWNCRNLAAEISCSTSRCEVSQTHTPMDISFEQSGKIQVCAYSGCWRGNSASILASGNYLVLVSDDLIWNAGQTRKTTTTSIVIDQSKLTGTIMIDEFAQPMTCKVNP